MQVFKPSNLSHVLKFISRNDSTDIIFKIRNELRNTETELKLTGVISNNIFTAEFYIPMLEGSTYEIEATDLLGNLLYRGKAFATNEIDLQNYKLIK